MEGGLDGIVVIYGNEMRTVGSFRTLARSGIRCGKVVLQYYIKIEYCYG